MKITIFGSRGLLGSELVNLKSSLDESFCPSSSEFDLSTKEAFSSHNDIWFNCAAKVGGIKSNTNYVADFYSVNSQINNNVMQGAKKCNVKKLVSVLSTCIYPDSSYVTYPITEDQLHMGPPHHSNFGYAFSKRMIDVSSRAYRQQYGCNFISAIPNNLYGPHDNYDLNDGHVIPSLIRKFFEAHLSHKNVTIWGTGTPLREFTYAQDAAKIMWWIAKNYDGEEPINIGNTEEVSIKDLANIIGKIIGFKGKVIFDSSKPDGQLRKPTSNNRLKNLGYIPQYTNLETGLAETIEHFIKKYPNLRGIK